MLQAAESIYVVTGKTVAQTFHVRSGTARARLLDGQGQPVASVPLVLLDAAGKPVHTMPPTDAMGWTSGEVEPASLTAAVRPKRLQDPNAQLEFTRTNAGNPQALAAAWLHCGTVRVDAGATTEVELRLPAGWDR